jgi:hypothetical protein
MGQPVRGKKCAASLELHPYGMVRVSIPCPSRFAFTPAWLSFCPELQRFSFKV